MKLLGENETEAVLERLDRLNHEEARTVAAQTLEVVYGLVKQMKVVMDGSWPVQKPLIRRPEHLSHRWQDIDREYKTGPRCALSAVKPCAC